MGQRVWHGGAEGGMAGGYPWAQQLSGRAQWTVEVEGWLLQTGAVLGVTWGTHWLLVGSDCLETEPGQRREKVHWRAAVTVALVKSAC